MNRFWVACKNLMILACFLTAAVFPAPAQKMHMHFEHLTILEGLSQSSTNSITQDHQGFLWFGTQDGLNRFDGYTFTIFSHEAEDSGSLSTNFIDQIFCDEQGTLWVATTDLVLNRFDMERETFDHFPLPIQSDSRALIRDIESDRRGNLWVATDTLGVFRFDVTREVFKRYWHEAENGNTIISNAVTSLHLDRHSILWAGTHDGLTQFDEQSDRFELLAHAEDHEQSRQHRAVNALAEDEFGNLWISSYRGVDRLDKDRRTWQAKISGRQLSPESNFLAVNQMVPDGKDLWLATENGLFFISEETNRIEHYTHHSGVADSLSDNMVFSAFMDRSKTLWIGTLNGLNYLDRGGVPFNHFKTEAGEENALSGNIVWSIMEDKRGILWVSTDVGLDRFDRNKGEITHFTHDPNNPKSLPPPIYNDIIQDMDGGYWIASYSGLVRFEKNPDDTRIFFNSKDPASLSDDNCLVLLQDRENFLWVGTNRGINRLESLESGRFQRFVYERDNPQSLHSNAVTTLYEDRAQQLWVGTDHGVSRIDKQRKNFVHFIHDPANKTGLSQGAVSSILEDRLGRIWIGVMGGGLNMLAPDSQRFVKFGLADGLPNKVINGILEDNRGALWVSTNRGLAKLNPKDNGFTRFGIHNGLQSKEFNAGSNFKSELTGELFFGGINGFNTFFPDRIKPNPIAPRPQITTLRIFNRIIAPSQSAGAILKKPIFLTEKIALDYKHNMFTLEFSAMHYAHPNSNLFAYKLDGFQEEWVTVSSQRRFASFTNLPPKTYSLRVKAANKDGIWGVDEPLLSVEIQPPPWRTWWAYSLYVLLFLAMIAGYTRFQNLRVRRERAISEQLRQLDRMKDDFLANTSHELRTPLNGIIGIAESLLVGAAGEVNEKLAANLGMIVSSGKRLANLVNDLLDFSKLKDRSLKLVRKPVDLNPLVDIILSLTRPLVGSKSLRLLNAIDPDTPMVDADEDRLQQIMHNLVGNAVKFTDSGHIKVYAQPEDNWLKIHVEDTGIGIASDQYARIFNSFEQLDEADTRTAGGTGLGLAVTRQLVELHGGTIEVSSELGSGSTFTFSLPISGTGEMETTPAGPVPIIAPPKTPPAMQPLPVYTNNENQFKILIVDDEPVNRQVLVNHLTLQNYRIAEAANGPEALALIKRGNFDLVLLDIMMPRMSGYEVCRAIRDTHAIQDLPIIFLTAKNQPTDLASGFAAGGSDYLAKPISRDELLSRVRTHLTLLDVHRNLEHRVEERTRELKIAYKTLEDMSLTDPLTGLRNRRFVLKNIESDVAQTNRAYLNWIEGGKKSKPPSESDLIFFLIDMDHFKTVNDTYGHAAGDEMLIQIRQILEKAFRTSDFLVRWGGEEFLVVARFTSRDAAGRMAERLRLLVGNHPFDIGGGQRLHRTASIGFAAYPFIATQPRLIGWSQVIDLADLTLYAAKHTGRDAWVGLNGCVETETKELIRKLLADPAAETKDGRLGLASSFKADTRLLWKKE